MSRSPRWSLKYSALAASFAIMLAACSGATTSSAPSSAPSTAPVSQAPASAAASAAAYAGISYPQVAVDCKNRPPGYTGEFSQIKAIDALTVEFDLCAPDVAFLSKIAFATNGIQDADYLAAHAKDKTLVRAPNGTGPYKFQEWISGDHITMVANPDYWGDAKPLSPTLIFKWAETAEKRLQDLQAGPETADGIDNVAPADFDAVSKNPALQLINRDAFTILYLGFNVDDPPWNSEAVRQAIAIGIDRKRINDTFNPAGSSVADYFTPCSVPGACEGDPWPAYDKAAAIAALKAANFDFSKTYDLFFRPKVRGYFPNPPGVAQDIQAQFADLGIKLKINTEDNATYLDNSAAGKYSLFLLGWGGDYPDMTDFVDYHFGTGANKAFGTKFKDLTDLLTKGASEVDATKRLEIYKQANNLIKQHVPMVPLNHAASAVAYQADVTGAQAGPLGNDAFWVVKPGDRQQIVFEQNSETSGLYCADESDGDSLRNCEQMFDPLYTYKIGGTEVIPNLATECTPNTEGTVWTCKLHDGVKFHDGATLDANDVVTTYAVAWDKNNPLHVGNGGSFEYFPGLFGGFLQPQ
jgi:peptide/nickel transport system substrate-binding protein